MRLKKHHSIYYERENTIARQQHPFRMGAYGSLYAIVQIEWIFFKWTYSCLADIALAKRKRESVQSHLHGDFLF